MSGLTASRLIVWRPAMASVLLHVLVLVGLTLNWTYREHTELVQPKVQPNYIKARLIDAMELKPKKKPTAVKPKPRAKPAQAKPAPKPGPKPKPVEQAPPKPQPEVSKSLTAAELAALAQQELALVMDAEDELLEQARDEDVAQSYIALISRAVQNNWSRPPSARNGMEAELIIQLIPTGEVVSVRVARSSGLLAFDRSAVNAVQKAQRFPELQQLPSRIFEGSFRQFRLLFKPEDLRF